MLKKTSEYLILFSSLVAVAAINYAFWNNPLVLLVTFILFIHEFGHYLAARRNNINAHLPFFIPLPYFPIGVTITDVSSGKVKKDISLSGALAASMSLVILIVINYRYNIISSLFLFSILFGEIFFNYIGMDGHRYRGHSLNQKIHSDQHIETKFSKEKIWKILLRNSYQEIKSNLLLKKK